MFSSKSQKLEKRIKELNALMAEYRKELEEAEKEYHRRKISKEEVDRIARRCQSKIESIGHKIRQCREDLDSLSD